MDSPACLLCQEMFTIQHLFGFWFRFGLGEQVLIDIKFYPFGILYACIPGPCCYGAHGILVGKIGLNLNLYNFFLNHDRLGSNKKFHLGRTAILTSFA